MVRAFAGDSTITSLVPCAFVAAPFTVAAPLFPLPAAAPALPAALLLAGTLYPTSPQRHGPSRPAVPRHRSDATSAACTIRGAATKCPSLLLSLQPSMPSRLFPFGLAHSLGSRTIRGNGRVRLPRLVPAA